MIKNNQQYLIVGLFVVISTAILTIVWLWFSASNHRSYNTYLTVFNEPINGITANSIIRYNGVEVGKIKSIKLDAKDPRNVFIYINVFKEIAISTDTFAVLKIQGITGLSYIDLQLPKESTNKKMLTPHNSEPYPQIPTHLSLLTSLTEQAQSIAKDVQEISTQIKILLNKKNIDKVSNIINSLDQVTTEVASRSDKIGANIDAITQILDNLKKSSNNIGGAIDGITNMTKSISQTSQNANSLLQSMRNNTLQNINTILLPNLNRTINNMNQSSYQLEQLLNTINQNPSALIRGIAPAKPGPGE